MLELGQPNHAYDLATLGGRGFRIRVAKPGETLTTLDDVERTLTADDLLICDADDRPIGLAGIMGGADTEISEATTTVALEMAWFAPSGVGRSRRPPRPALGGVAPLRARRRSVRHRHGHRPLRRAARRDVSRPRRPRRRRRRPRSVAAAAAPVVPGARVGGQPHHRHDAHRRRPAAAARPDRLHRLRRRRRPRRRPPVVATRQHRGDRRHRGGRPACTATTASARPLPSSPGHGRLSLAQQRRRRLRECCSASASPRRCRTRSSRPTRWLGPGSTATPCASPTRSSPRRACCGRRCGPACCGPSRSTSRTAGRGVSLFEIGHVYPPGPGELPDEYEALGVVLAGEEAPAAVAVWREIAAAMGVGARIDQSVVPAGPAPDAVGDARRRPRRDRRVGEVAPEVLEAFGIAERVAVVELDLRSVLGHEPKPAQWKPTSRSPVERSRPGLRPARRRAGREARQGDPPGRRRAARRPRPVRRVPRRRASARAGAASPTGCACRPPTATSPTPTSPTCASGSPRRRPSSGPSCAADGGSRAAGPAGCGSSCRWRCRRCSSAASPSPCAAATTTRASRSPARRPSCPPSSAPPRSCSGRCRRPTRSPPSSAQRYGEVTVALGRASPTSSAFAAEFDRLPDAEARLLGRTLGAIQAQLSPTAVDGARDDDDRAPDIVFALQLARAVVQAADPDGHARATRRWPCCRSPCRTSSASTSSPRRSPRATWRRWRRASTPGSRARPARAAALTEAGAAELISADRQPRQRTPPRRRRAAAAEFLGRLRRRIG